MEGKPFSVETVTDLEPGGHLCWIYDTEEDHRAVLTPFMRQGLERTEKVLYFADERTAATILDYLRRDGVDVAPYLERGQLRVLACEEVYRPEGVFEPEAMIALLRTETGRALAEGYAALRVTGEMSWVLHPSPDGGAAQDSMRRLVEYEAKLNRFFPGSRCLAICQYDQRRFSPQFLLRVLRAHPLAVVGQQVYENVYYIPPDELLDMDPAATELKWLIHNLARHRRGQAELQAERDFSDALLNTAGALVVVLDREGRIVRFNHMCEQVTGYTEEEVLGRRVWDFLLPPDEADAVRDTFDALRAGQFPNTLENVWLTKHGDQRLIAWSNTVLVDNDRTVAYIIGTGLDVTEQREAEVQTERLNRVLRAIRGINQLIARERDRQRLILAACEELAEVETYSHVWCFLVDELGRPEVMAEAEPGISASLVILSDAAEVELAACTCQALEEQSLVVTTASDASLKDVPWSVDRLEDVSVVSVCLSRADRVYGVLTVCLPPAFDVDAEEQALLREIAGDIAFALHNLEQEERRRHAEQALRKSEHFLNAVLDSIQDGISVLDRDLNILHVNPVMNTWYRENLPLEGKKCYVAYHNRDAPCSPCPTLRAMRTGVTERDEVSGLPGSSAEWLELFSYPMKDPATGEIAAVVEFVRDITERVRLAEERKRLLAEVQRQAEQLRQVMDGVPVGVILLDNMQRVVVANRVAREDLRTLAGVEIGSTLTQLGGQPIEVLLTSVPGRGWHEVSSGGRSFEIIARQVSSAQGWVLVINEVTRQRELERSAQQQARLSAVGQLAAGIAHDFNNIMSVILLYAQMGLRQPGVPSELSRHLEVIVGQANRATELIQQILDFSRRAVLERRPMDLRPFLEEVVRLMRRMLPENIEVELAYEPGDYTVNADPTRLQQVIMNLAINARDAMPDGGNLRISLRHLHIEGRGDVPLPEMRPGDWVVMSVSDTGSGISPDVLPHIFEPFFTTKEAGQGSGLGLAQVYGIVRQHAGFIDVSTEVGVGTTFTIYLPALLLPSSGNIIAVNGDILVEGQRETLLVVEDNDTLRAALADSLRQIHYRVLEASDGQEALAVLRRHPEIALVLSDVVMPVMGGLALVDALLVRGLSVPTILLSGHPLSGKMTERPGVAGWMLKPPNLAELTQLVARLLQDSRV